MKDIMKFPILFCIVILFSNGIRCQKLTVAVPNTFRMGAMETIALNLHSGGTQNVSVYLRDIGGKHNFSRHNMIIRENEPKLVTVKVTPDDIPDLMITGTLAKHYTILVVTTEKSSFFHKEVVILVTPYSGYMFLQSDKPIYTPKQIVHLRVIPLNENMTPDNQTFKLQIRNPQDVVVEEILSSGKEMTSKGGIYDNVFTFPRNPKYGIWSAVVLYGNKVQRNSTVKFEVKEYVLPTFEVKIKVPDVILPHHDTIEVSVTATYVYGEKVDGFVTFKFGVESESKHVHDFGKTSALEMARGVAIYSFKRSELTNNKHIRHFPGKGSRLIVEATVLERSTGRREKVVDKSAEFAGSPYVISFKNCLRDFKQGLSVVIQADVTYVNKKPAAGVKTRIQVTDQRKVKLQTTRNSEHTVTDEKGKAYFTINTDMSHTHLYVTVETTDNGLDIAEETSASHELSGYKSQAGYYIALGRSVQNTPLQVGKTHSFSIYSNLPNGASVTFTYLIVAQGHIQEMRSFQLGRSLEQNIQLTVTPEMAPSMRVVVFTVHNKELLADSLKYDVVNVCKPSGQISMTMEKNRLEPGEKSGITIKASHNTAVGLLAVDKAVYALRNEDLLTKEKMFRMMDDHDLGCGPGGGSDNEKILANAGIVVITDATAEGAHREEYGCLERKRKKREIKEMIESRYIGTEKTCCSLGLMEDKYERTCEERADIIRAFDGGLEGQSECAKAFLTCCLDGLNSRIFKDKSKLGPETLFLRQNFMGSTSNTFQARTLGNDNADLDFIDDTDGALDRETIERKHFPETWIVQTMIIGSTNQSILDVSVPDSITSWVVQAVGISPHGGMCVADPLTLTTFKNVFIDLKLPYKVVRNEQIELQASIFNYGSKRLPVMVYMYGVEGLCTGAEPKEKTERQRVYVSPNSAVMVGFPVVPLEIGDIPIQVVALSAGGQDKITKTLSVVAEGIEQEKDIQIPLDPSNVQRRKRRSIVHEDYSVQFDDDKKEQLSIVKLQPNVDFIPDTESCLVTAIGDRFGPAVHITLANPEKLIKRPVGCGEQTMAFMAPTLYILHYLKATGKLNAEHEKTAYQFVREGYNRELTFRKDDGSFSTFTSSQPSTWLTAFVIKVFCQAHRYVYVDDKVVCTGLQWLSKQQNEDGTFHDKVAIIHKQMMGGVTGGVPMTAFVLNTFQKCVDVCQNSDFSETRAKATAFLEGQVPNAHNPYITSILAYSLALAGSEQGLVANEKLQNLSRHDEGFNTRYWHGSQAIETASLALLTNLYYHDIETSTSIVNWLNSKQSSIGTFWNTQDTVVALEALSEYAILARSPDVNLVCNMSSSNDATFTKTLTFHNANARVLRSYEIDKVGGQLYFKAEGSGVGQIGVKLRYNVPVPPHQLCKFDLKITVNEAKEVLKQPKPTEEIPLDFFDDDVEKQPKPHDLKKFPKHLLDNLGLLKGPHNRNLTKLEKNLEEILAPARRLPAHRHHKMMNLNRRLRRRIVVDKKDDPRSNVKLQSKYMLNITICVRYFGHHDTDMAIVDAGIFTGFTALTEDLKNLVEDKSIPISSFEETGRSVIFYLDQVPHNSTLCFWFRIQQEFIVGKIQPGVVQVYDYYNPGQTCTDFYSPDKSSPILRTICVGRVCKCAEGGCPSEDPFTRVKEEVQITGKRNVLRWIACHEHEFVWKVKVMHKKSTNNTDFTKLFLRVEKVLKEGLENAKDLEDTVKEFSVRSGCKTGNLLIKGTYIIMGKDQVPFQDDDGLNRYRYYLDKKTKIYEWFEIKNHPNKPNEVKDLQKAFIWFENNFVKNGGCLD